MVAVPWVRVGVAKTEATGIGPVNYLPLARLDYDAFYAAGCADSFFDHHTISQQANAYELYQLSVDRGLMVKTALVLDMRGGGVSNLRHKQFDQQFKPEQEKIDKAMAESVGVIYILSMPSWLQPLFSLMKKVMPPRTLQKLVNVPRCKEREILLPVVGPECWQRIADQRSEADESDPSAFHVAAGKVYSRTVLASMGQRVSWTFAL